MGVWIQISRRGGSLWFNLSLISGFKALNEHSAFADRDAIVRGLKVLSCEIQWRSGFWRVWRGRDGI